MRWIEHRCLACGHLAARSRARLAIGAPFERCSACGGFVVRPLHDEWGLMSPRARLAFLAPGAARALALGLAPALVWGLFVLARGGERDPLALLLLAALGAGVALGVWLGRVASAVRRSRRRLADPMLRARLVEFGLASRGAAAPALSADVAPGPR